MKPLSQSIGADESGSVDADYAYESTYDVVDRVERADATRWIWDGYLAAGNVTLLVGPWKAGKTTLLSVLLARIGSGGLLGGLPVRASRAVVISEEAHDLWAERIERLGLAGQFRLVSRPFRGRPTPEQWQHLIDSLIARHQHTPFDLLIIDPLASFLPARTENHAGIMLDVLLPLQSLTQMGVCVLILHHPRKAQSVPGRTARGTGALIGSVDIILELDHVGETTDDDRRRRLVAFSRHRATPRRLVLEMTPDGMDYVALGDYAGHEFEGNWPILYGILEDASGKMTRREILDAWPADYVKPGKLALWRWLDRALKDGLLLHDGTGRRNKPFRYWLDGMEEVWQSEPFYLPPLEPFEDPMMRRKTLQEVLGERAKKGRKCPGEPGASATGVRPKVARFTTPQQVQPAAAVVEAEATAEADGIPS